jgi:hypothetical protein
MLSLIPLLTRVRLFRCTAPLIRFEKHVRKLRYLEVRLRAKYLSRAFWLKYGQNYGLRR